MTSSQWLTSALDERPSTEVTSIGVSSYTLWWLSSKKESWLGLPNPGGHGYEVHSGKKIRSKVGFRLRIFSGCVGVGCRPLGMGHLDQALCTLVFQNVKNSCGGGDDEILV